MNPRMVIPVCVALIASALGQSAAAGPVTFVVRRTAHFANRVAYKIDNHFLRPARRVIVHHTPR